MREIRKIGARDSSMKIREISSLPMLGRALLPYYWGWIDLPGAPIRKNGTKEIPDCYSPQFHNLVPVKCASSSSSRWKIFDFWNRSNIFNNFLWKSG